MTKPPKTMSTSGKSKLELKLRLLFLAKKPVGYNGSIQTSWQMINSGGSEVVGS